MNNSTYMRKLIKAEAWKNLSGNWLKSFLIAAIQALLTTIIISFLPIRHPTIGEIMAVSGDAQAMLRLFVPGEITTRMLVLTGATVLLYILVMAPLSIGICRFFLKVSKGEKPKVSEIFSVYTSLKTVFSSVWLSILVTLISAFWLCLFVFIPILIAFLGMYLRSMLIIYFSYILSPFTGLLAALGNSRYVFASYIFAEDEEKGAFASLRECISLLRGRSGECIMLRLSYTLWDVISFNIFPLRFVYFALSNEVYARYLAYLRGDLKFEGTDVPPTF